MNQTLNLVVKKQIDDKFKTFCNWNYKEIIQKNKKDAKQSSIMNRKLLPRDNN